MDYQRALENIISMKVEIQEESNDTKQMKRIKTDTLDIAKEAIEKQIPKEVKEIHVDEYYCPACGSENNCSNKIVEHKYCPECGQRLVSRRKLQEGNVLYDLQRKNRNNIR